MIKVSEMLGSRVLPIVARLGQNNGKRLFSTTIKRNGGSGAAYRATPHIPPFTIKYADCCGAFFWWWIFWNAFTNYEVVTGHHPWVEESSWTDAELGIPADDAPDPDM